MSSEAIFITLTAFSVFAFPLYGWLKQREFVRIGLWGSVWCCFIILWLYPLDKSKASVLVVDDRFLHQNVETQILDLQRVQSDGEAFIRLDALPSAEFVSQVYQPVKVNTNLDASELQLNYEPDVYAKSLWAMKWGSPGKVKRVQLANSSGTIIKSVEPNAMSGSLVHVFANAGPINWTVELELESGEKFTRAIAVAVREPTHRYAQMNFASPSVQWRALKLWLEESAIEYQSKVRVAEGRFRYDRSEKFLPQKKADFEVWDERTFISEYSNLKNNDVFEGRLLLVLQSDNPRLQGIIERFNWKSELVTLPGNENTSASPISAYRNGSAKILVIRAEIIPEFWSKNPHSFSEFFSTLISNEISDNGVWLNRDTFKQEASGFKRLCFDNAGNRATEILVNNKKISGVFDGASVGSQCATLPHKSANVWDVSVASGSLEDNQYSPSKPTMLWAGQLWLADNVKPDERHARLISEIERKKADELKANERNEIRRNVPIAYLAYIVLLLFLGCLWWLEMKHDSNAQ